jgi:hypothetical protein
MWRLEVSVPIDRGGLERAIAVSARLAAALEAAGAVFVRARAGSGDRPSGYETADPGGLLAAVQDQLPEGTILLVEKGAPAR